MRSCIGSQIGFGSPEQSGGGAGPAFLQMDKGPGQLNQALIKIPVWAVALGKPEAFQKRPLRGPSRDEFSPLLPQPPPSKRLAPELDSLAFQVGQKQVAAVEVDALPSACNAVRCFCVASGLTMPKCEVVEDFPPSGQPGAFGRRGADLKAFRRFSRPRK